MRRRHNNTCKAMKYSLQNKTPPVRNGIGKCVCLSTSPDKSSMEVVKLKTEEGEKIINSFVGLQEKIRMVWFFFFNSLICHNYGYGTKITMVIIQLSFIKGHL